jgi:polyisoprenoid-binding protein YceI
MSAVLNVRDWNGVQIPAAGTFKLDPAHTRVGFMAKHMMVSKVRGTFNEFEGTITVAENPLESTVTATITTSSIHTRQEMRDNHLRSNDFLAMDEYPEIVFESTGVERVGEDSARVSGDLTIRGVTKPVAFEMQYTGSAKDPFGNLRLGFEGATVINRKDWGVSWNASLETGGVLVSEKVTLEFDVSAIKLT